MFKHVLVLGLGAAVLSAAALPQQASAQSMRSGYGQMGGGAPDDFRMHGGQGQFGGGRGQFGRNQAFHNQFRPFGNSGLAHNGSNEVRFHGEPGRFGGDRGFRFGGEQHRFGGREGYRFDRAADRGFGYRPGVRFGTGFEHRHGFERPALRYGYGVAAIRHYPVYRPGFRGGYGFAGPYPVRVGYGFPGAGCTTSRTTSLTPAGWRKIVTVRVCYVR